MNTLAMIRMLRAVATAIRTRDLPALDKYVHQLAELVGLDKELAELHSFREAIQSRELKRILDALTSVLSLFSTHLNSTPLIGSMFGDVDNIPTQLESEAAHLEIHCGLSAGAVAAEGDAPKVRGAEPAGLAMAVSPSTILLIVQAVSAAVRWWRDRNPEMQAVQPEPVPGPSLGR